MHVLSCCQHLGVLLRLAPLLIAILQAGLNSIRTFNGTGGDLNLRIVGRMTTNRW